MELVSPSSKKNEPVADTKIADDPASLTSNKYNDKISKLPRIDGWSDGEQLYNYQGFWNTSVYLEGILQAQDHFTPQLTDIFLCTFPKSGTTWLKALCTAILTRKHLEDPSHPLLKKLPHEIVPVLETELYPLPSSFVRYPEIPLISTHISYSSLPKSIVNSDCKIIYVCRDPKDVFVSFLHFYVNWRRLSLKDFPLEKAFESYCKGFSHGGPFWNHILEYWKASLELPEKLLFLRFENLKDDTLSHVKKIAKFMGCGFSLEEEEQGVVKKIVEFCSFDNLSNLQINRIGQYHMPRIGTLENSSFFRKGQKGDWKNLLTPEMAEKLDKLTEEKLGGSGLTFSSCS